jgi:hypothetical protein
MVSEEEKRQPKPKADAVKPDKKITRVYFCPNQVSQSFYVPMRDKEGNLIPSTDRQGRQKYVNGAPLFIDTLCKFETLISGTKKHPGKTLCTFTLNEKDPLYDDKLKELERLKTDQATWVMDQQQYDSWRNKEASEFKRENETLKSQITEQANMIEEMKKRVAELTEKPASGK